MAVRRAGLAAPGVIPAPFASMLQMGAPFQNAPQPVAAPSSGFGFGRRDPRLALALGAAGRGFLEGGSRGGLGMALLGATSAALPAFVRGQQLLNERADVQREREAAAAKLASEEARATAKGRLERQKAAQGRFKTVGTDLFDVSGAEPRLAARGRRASEPLVPVFDPATGETRFRTRAEAVGQMAPPKTGMEVVTDPATGQTVVRTGVTPGQGTEIGTKGRNKIEDQMIDLTAARQRLGNIAASWRPEFSELPNQLGMTFNEVRDRTGVGFLSLNPDQKAALADYSQWQQNTRQNLNRTIKEITGAAMTEGEAARIRGEVPNLEDGPTVFQAKMQNSIRLTNLAQARLAHLRNQGLPASGNFGGIGLDEMPEIIDRRGAEIEQQMIAQGMAPELAEQQAMAQVRQEFGI